MPNYAGGGLTHGQALATITGMSAFSSSPVQIVRFNWPEVNRESIELTNMNVLPTASGEYNFGNKMYMPSAYIKPGELHLQILHDSTVTSPINPAGTSSFPGVDYITINYGPATPDGGAQQTAKCLAWMKSYELEGELDGKALIANIVLVITDVLDNSYSDTGAVTGKAAS
jgi:hypothetical protein